MTFVVTLAVLTAALAAPAAASDPWGSVTAASTSADDASGTFEGRLLAPVPLDANPLAMAGPVGGFTGVTSETIGFRADAGGYLARLEATEGTVSLCFRDATGGTLDCVASPAHGPVPAGARGALVQLAEGLDVSWKLEIYDDVPPVITILSPTPGDRVTGSTVHFSMFAVDAESGLRSADCGTRSAVFDCNPSIDVRIWHPRGDDQFTVTAVDRAGNVASVAVPFSVAQPTAVSAGGWHTCALGEDGGIDCWGGNWGGQLGDGTQVDRRIPVRVTGIANAIAVSAGMTHTCAVLGTGEIQCWGSGSLGDGAASTSATPVRVSGITNAVAVSAGTDHTCAVLGTGHVYCWGANGQGQLGDGTTVSRSTPVQAVSLAGAKSVAVGEFHTCARLASGTTSCWGSNSHLQLGVAGGNRLVPTPVAISGVAEVVAGRLHTCWLQLSGAVSCFGSNEYGQLGTVTGHGFTVPIPPATRISAGLGHTCAYASPTVHCWGLNVAGALGDGTHTGGYQPRPIAPPSLNAISLDAGLYHTCAVRSAPRQIYCWGLNGVGALGDGTDNSRTVPTLVVGFS